MERNSNVNGFISRLERIFRTVNFHNLNGVWVFRYAFVIWSNTADIIYIFLVFFCYSLSRSQANIHLTSISNYFHQFGEIEFVAPPFCGAIGTLFICFKDFKSAFNALILKDHFIDGHLIHLRHDWYLCEMENRVCTCHIMEGIHSQLNDDCILMVMQYLNLIDLLHMAKFNHRFYLLSKQITTIEILPSNTTQPIGLMTLRYAFTILGNTVTKLIISLKAMHVDTFNTHSYFLKFAILYCIQAYTGSQLKYVRLEQTS